MPRSSEIETDGVRSPCTWRCGQKHRNFPRTTSIPRAWATAVIESDALNCLSSSSVIARIIVYFRHANSRKRADEHAHLFQGGRSGAFFREGRKHRRPKTGAHVRNRERTPPLYSRERHEPACLGQGLRRRRHHARRRFRKNRRPRKRHIQGRSRSPARAAGPHGTQAGLRRHPQARRNSWNTRRCHLHECWRLRARNRSALHAGHQPRCKREHPRTHCRRLHLRVQTKYFPENRRRAGRNNPFGNVPTRTCHSTG